MGFRSSLTLPSVMPIVPLLFDWVLAICVVYHPATCADLLVILVRLYTSERWSQNGLECVPFREHLIVSAEIQQRRLWHATGGKSGEGINTHRLLLRIRASPSAHEVRVLSLPIRRSILSERRFSSSDTGSFFTRQVVHSVMDRKYLSPYNQRDQKLNYLLLQRKMQNKERVLSA